MVQKLKPSETTGTTGILNKDMLFGNKGTEYTLFVEPYHTGADIDRAKQWLYKNREVTKITFKLITGYKIARSKVSDLVVRMESENPFKGTFAGTVISTGYYSNRWQLKSFNYE